jgi:predicted membrane metal-binding protein
MKDLLNKIFTLNGLIFLAVLFVVLVAILIFAPVEATLFGGIVLFVIMAAIMLWAVKKYNSTTKP